MATYVKERKREECPSYSAQQILQLNTVHDWKNTFSSAYGGASLLDESKAKQGIISTCGKVKKAIDYLMSNVGKISASQEQDVTGVIENGLDSILGPLYTLKSKSPENIMVNLVYKSCEKLKKEISQKDSYTVEDTNELIKHLNIDTGRKARQGDRNVGVTINYQKLQNPSLIDVNAFATPYSVFVNNALDAMGKKGELTVDIYQKDGNLITQVTDTGKGIPKDKQSEIGKFRATFGKGDKGTGIGVWGAKKELEKHGGKIWFKSKKGKGTTFFASVPLEAVAAYV